MQAGATFADVLDATLGAPTRAPSTAGWSNRPVTPPLFVFEFPLAAKAAATATQRPRPVSSVNARSQAFSAIAAAEESQVRKPRPVDPAEPSARPAPAPKFRLTTLEARALAALNALGADLDDSVCPETLRKAFRRLAHRYHPDRHPGIGATETARLARQFADATAHYRPLAAGLDRCFASR